VIWPIFIVSIYVAKIVCKAHKNAKHGALGVCPQEIFEKWAL